MKATVDGSLNPEWIQQKSTADELFTKIRAYYLPGPKIKKDVQCRAVNCVMPTRVPGAINVKTVKEEFNPMLFCYFCDRTFHAGCCNLDSSLIKEEKVPWRCADCLSNLKNNFAVKYEKETGYKLSMKTRRGKFLRESVIPDDESQYSSDAEFETADKESFKRRALQVASQADQTMNLSSLDEASEMDLLQHSIMRVKADERRAQETNKRVLAQLEAEQTIAKQAMSEIEALRKQIELLTASGMTQSVPTIQIHPAATSTTMPSTSANATLTSQYISGDTTAFNERSDYVYAPQPVPVRQSNLSSAEMTRNSDPDVSTLLTRLTASQERDEERKLLEMRRKAVPKIAEFNGDSSKWLAFRQDVERYRVNCQFDDETIKLYLRGALKGEAFQLVKDLFDRRTLDHIMDVLKLAYGDEMMLIRKRSEELRKVKIDSHLYRSEVVKLQAAIQAYFAACNYAGLGYLNSNELGEAVFAQFGPEDRQRCKEHCRRANPGTIVISIQAIYDYLLDRLPLLDDIPTRSREKNQPSKNERSDKRSYQTNLVVDSTSSDKEGYKFELRDKQTAVYMGYDMAKVNELAKKCEICGRANHFSFQCNLYRAMDENGRSKIIAEKNLCRSCVVTTTHKANECNIKAGCGMKLNRGSRCSQKHHISIHNAVSSQPKNFNGNKNKRRPNTNANTNNANERIQDATNNQPDTPAVSYHAVEQEDPVRKYEVVQVLVNANDSSNRRRTVKVFKLNFIGPKGMVTEYAVGDSGSEVTLMREDLRLALGIEGVKKDLCVQWTDSSKKASHAMQFDLKLRGVGPECQTHVLKDCLAVNYLNLPPRSLNMEKVKEQYPYLAEAEFESYSNIRPVMLIGSPHAYLMEGNGKLLEGGEHGPVALTTKLGWTVYGGSSPSTLVIANVQNAVAPEEKDETETVELDETQQNNKVTNEQLNDMFDYFSSIESLGIKSKETQMTEKEKSAVELIEEEMKVLDDGKIEVPLIWDRNNKELPSLPNNYPMAYQRQLNEETRLRKDPDRLQAYNTNVKELLDLGFLRYATPEDMNTNWPNVWYLPMRLVENANKDPPKRRNVYDASAVYKSVSLNSKLLKGPDLLVNILQPLLRMRMGEFAFTADVAKMFHMMKLPLRDQQCQRILFRERHDEPMQTLILSVMSFGPTSSPFTSQYVKNWNADRWMSTYPEAANTLKHYTYMDDVLTSESTLDKAIQVANQCIEICNDIGWKLTNFQSNSVELLQSLPPSNVKKDLIPLLENENESHVTKVLGCHWNTKSDCFEYHLDENLFVRLVNEFNQRPTKRDQASTIARIYDSLGFIANYTILGRMLLQRSWQLKLDWDEVIPDEEAKLWKEWLQEISNIAKLQISRRYTSLNSIMEAEELELHTFCDAGGEAFGAVTYLVVRKGDLVEAKIVMAKAKVAPLRMRSKTTICEMPRLELIAALTAARLSDTITKIYNQVNLTRYFWSDSEVVLRWILNPNHKLVKYAISPIEEILELTERKEWRYVPTKLNPADLCTKYRKFDIKVASTTWLNGPEFIKSPIQDWPQLPEKLFKSEPLMANNICLETLNYSTHELPPVDCPIANDLAIDRLSPSITSSWMKLVRATARTLKIYMDGFVPIVLIKRLHNLDFLRKFRRLMHYYEELSPTDLERAEHFLFRKIQREEFPTEYKLLQKGSQVRNKEFRQLNVFMDQEGILRINSRVNLNTENFPQQFAPLLPKKNALVSIFLMHCHQNFKHIALESQIAQVRTKCWIPQLRSAMRSIKSKCNLCNLRNAKPYEPPMAPLPDYRTNPEGKPFEVTGIDVLGPIIINRSKKIYILIFACALTRYVHLHILESLESLRVLEAIVVFWTAYGPVRKIVSDNGTNFRGAAKVLREDYNNSKLFLQQQSSILHPKLAEMYCIEWEFISAYAPWFGGLYERLIKEVKRALYDTLNNRRLQKVELNIAIHETAHRLNCRPLVENSLDAADEEILTPHHLAKNRSGWPLLAGIHKNKFVQVDDRSLYRRGRILADEIMRKFVSYHLPTLTRRTKWHEKDGPIKIDDLVLMIEPNQTRRQWARGRVVKLHKGRDGHVRSADIILANGKIKMNRAVRNLAKIKISLNQADENVPTNQSLSNNCIFISDSSSLPNLDFRTYNLIASEQLNLNLIILLFFTSQDNLEELTIMAGGKRRKQTANGTRQTQVVKLANISTSTTLSTVANYLLNNNFDSVVATFRAADYVNEIMDTDVLLYMTNSEEVARLVESDAIYIDGQIAKVYLTSLIPAVAEFPVDLRDREGADYRGAPIPIALFKLRSMPCTHTTLYVFELLWAFEKITRVTGMRLIFEEHRNKTRSFGFMTVLSRVDMAENLNRQLTVFGDPIKTDFTNTTQVLLPAANEHLLNERRRCELTREVMELNCLTFDVSKLRVTFPIAPTASSSSANQAQSKQKSQDKSELLDAGPTAHSMTQKSTTEPEDDQLSSYTPPLPIEAYTSHKPAEGILKKKSNKANKRKYVRFDVDDVSSSMSGLSLGDDYQLEEDGEITSGK